MVYFITIQFVSKIDLFTLHFSFGSFSLVLSCLKLKSDFSFFLTTHWMMEIGNVLKLIAINDEEHGDNKLILDPD